MFFGEFLVQDNIITKKQLENAINFQKENLEMRIGQVFVHLDYIDHSKLKELLELHLTNSATAILSDPEFANELKDL